MSVKVRNKSVTEVLDAVFKENGINYIIVENQVVLKPLKTGNDINWRFRANWASNSAGKCTTHSAVNWSPYSAANCAA
jgi:hypothetical protein